MNYKLHYRGKFRNDKTYLRFSTTNITIYEKIFQSLLITTCTPFYRQYPFKSGNSFILVDFYIPSSMIVFEIDGNYHCTTKQKRIDKGKEYYLAQRGIKIIRIENRNLKYWSSIRIYDKIKRYAL